MWQQNLNSKVYLLTQLTFWTWCVQDNPQNSHNRSCFKMLVKKNYFDSIEDMLPSRNWAVVVLFINMISRILASFAVRIILTPNQLIFLWNGIRSGSLVAFKNATAFEWSSRVPMNNLSLFFYSVCIYYNLSMWVLFEQSSLNKLCVDFFVSSPKTWTFLRFLPSSFFPLLKVFFFHQGQRMSFIVLIVKPIEVMGLWFWAI